MSNLSDAVREKFPHKKIVVVGDIVADQFLHGTIARVSREAPVFILRHDETETSAGGAGNAAANIASLGAEAILIGVIGRDKNGDALLAKLSQSNVNCEHIVLSEKYQTTTKVRVLAGQHYAPRQQVIRIDYENPEKVDENLRNQIKANLFAALEKADAVVISDYGYGAATPETAGIVCRIAAERKIPVLIDSRFNLRNFRGATTATPNQDEVEQILGENFSESDCVRLCKKLEFESLLITRGNQGMLLVENDKSPVSIEAVGAKEPVDVTGAGDTVIAVYALGLSSGLSFADAARLANHAGGIVVMKKGTASASSDELLVSLTKNKNGEHKTQTK